MITSNEPTEIILTPDNLLETLMLWLPDQFDKMRQYTAGTVRVKTTSISSLDIRYMNTIGGERFRINDVNDYMGESGSDYYEPLGQDDDVILAFALRMQRYFNTMRRANVLTRQDRPIEAMLRFQPGPFAETKEIQAVNAIA